MWVLRGRAAPRPAVANRHYGGQQRCAAHRAACASSAFSRNATSVSTALSITLALVSPTALQSSGAADRGPRGGGTRAAGGPTRGGAAACSGARRPPHALPDRLPTCFREYLILAAEGAPHALLNRRQSLGADLPAAVGQLFPQGQLLCVIQNLLLVRHGGGPGLSPAAHFGCSIAAGGSDLVRPSCGKQPGECWWRSRSCPRRLSRVKWKAELACTSLYKSAWRTSQAVLVSSGIGASPN